MAKRAQGRRTEVAASITIDLVCGRFVDLALAFASVDPIAAETEESRLGYGRYLESFSGVE